MVSHHSLNSLPWKDCSLAKGGRRQYFGQALTPGHRWRSWGVQVGRGAADKSLSELSNLFDVIRQQKEGSS